MRPPPAVAPPLPHLTPPPLPTPPSTPGAPQLIAGTLCQAIWPSFQIFSVAASSVFSIPFWRHFLAWMGSVPATRGNFKRVLKQGSVAVVVGGIAEM